MVRAGDRACLVGVRRYSAPVLDELDDVTWAECGRAYGSAADIPDLLQQAASEGNAAGVAISALYARLFHQGTVYPTTAAAVPFLAELARRGRRAEASSAGCSP